MSLTASLELSVQTSSPSALPRLLNLDQENLNYLPKQKLFQMILLANKSPERTQEMKFAAALISQRLIEVPNELAVHPAYHGQDIEEILFTIYDEIGSRFDPPIIVGRYTNYVIKHTHAENQTICLFKKSITKGIAEKEGVAKMSFTCDYLFKGKFSKSYVTVEEVPSYFAIIKKYIPARKMSELEKQQFIVRELVRICLQDSFTGNLFVDPIILKTGETCNNMHTDLRKANHEAAHSYIPNRLIQSLVEVINRPCLLSEQFESLANLFKDPQTGLPLVTPVVVENGVTYDESTLGWGIPNKIATKILSILQKYSILPS